MIANLKSNTDKNGENTICLKLSAFTVAGAAVRVFCAVAAARVYRDRGSGVAAEPGAKAPAGAQNTRPDADKSSDAIKGKERLFAGNAVFDEIRVLQPREFDGEAVLDMTDDAALRLADHDHGADDGAQVGCDRDRGARLRQVDDAAGDVDAARQDQPRDRIARREAAMAAVFRQVEDLPVGEPGELRGKLVALAQCRRNAHGEAVLDEAGDLALEPAEMVDIGDDAFAGIANHRSDQGYAAGRHVDDLTRKFAPVGEHVAAEQVDLDPLMAPAFLRQRQNPRALQLRCGGHWRHVLR